MVCSSAKLKMKLTMKRLLSLLHGHVVHADGEEGPGGGDEDGGPWTADSRLCSLVYYLFCYSRHSMCLAVLGMSPTVSTLSVMKMATELVQVLLCSSYTSRWRLACQAWKACSSWPCLPAPCCRTCSAPWHGMDSFLSVMQLPPLPWALVRGF